MDFVKELKNVSISVLPIALIALALGLIYGLFPATVPLWFFIVSIALIIFGLALFLLGVNLGFVSVGNQLGAFVTKKQNILALVIVGLLIGMIITIAEPDVAVLASQVVQINPLISKNTLILMIALGVGLFMALSYIRTVSGFSIKLSVSICIVLVLSLAAFVPEFFVSVAFDSGGATTGPIAVPFIMALGSGIASGHGNKEEDSFGYTGIASFGPVFFVLLLGVFSSGTFVPVSSFDSALGIGELFLEVAIESSLALIPLVAISALVAIFIMKPSIMKTLRLISGIVYTWVGIIIFLFGVKAAFMPVAASIGGCLASENRFLLVITGLVLGASVVLAEPAIWLLTEQVEEVSQGRIKKRVMLAFISIGVASAVVLSMVRILEGLSIWYFILPGYLTILALMLFCPRLFVAIAFDSGGVATGPMSSTFLLPFAIGAASVLSESTAEASFGMIGLIAMMPILTIEVLGVVFSVIIKKSKKGEAA